MKESEHIEKFFTERICEDCLKIIKNHSQSFPIMMVKLAKNLGLTVYDLKHIEEEKRHGWITYYKVNDKGIEEFRISINPMYHENAQRFTIAHEIAHFLLHKDALMKEGSFDRMARGDIQVYTKREFEANLLASELLMPTDEITLIVKKYIQDTTPKASLSILISKKVSEKFQVSATTSLRRVRRAMHDLGML